jgi:hypothetical protein
VPYEFGVKVSIVTTNACAPRWDRGWAEGERRQAMTEWANYDIDAKRVPPSSKRAAFRAKEVSIDTGVRAPPGHASLAGVEYRDGHAIDRSELRKTLKSFSMQRCGSRSMPQAQRVGRSRMLTVCQSCFLPSGKRL